MLTVILQCPNVDVSLCWVSFYSTLWLQWIPSYPFKTILKLFSLVGQPRTLSLSLTHTHTHTHTHVYQVWVKLHDSYSQHFIFFITYKLSQYARASVPSKAHQGPYSHHFMYFVTYKTSQYSRVYIKFDFILAIRQSADPYYLEALTN